MVTGAVSAEDLDESVSTNSSRTPGGITDDAGRACVEITEVPPRLQAGSPMKT